MSLQACADIVAKGDPDRFAAAMAAPVAARKVLFAIYAFNVEVTRAAWVASEPMIGEMRLQWWRDVLDEIAQGGAVRSHEVATPLAQVLDAEAAQALDTLVQARRWDLYSEAFADADHFDDYISKTGGVLMWICARLLGAELQAATKVTALGRSAALARFLAAVPELEARGRIPLVDGRTDAVQSLCQKALKALPPSGELKMAVRRSAHPALLEGWQAYPLLSRAVQKPHLVGEGSLRLSEFEKRARLLQASFFGI
ncbi:MAG: squalene/phytoene synthase family protein [Silicimonas sp.]|nr:squalene/phytoene synthase family protein [Silicimonas sp.]